MSIALLAWQCVACVLVADFITGLVHWWEDTFGLPTWPILGKAVVEPNIDHHRNPGLIGSMGGIVFRNYQSLLLFAAVGGLFWLCGWFTWQVAVTGVVAGFGNEVHTWSHRKSSLFVRILQEMAVVQTPQQHAKHHRGNHDECYCTMTNIVNPILDHCKFWRALEWIIARCGIPIKRMTAARDYL